MIVIPDLNNVTTDYWDHQDFRENKLQVEVLRLDKIHPEVSGNKWFKLKYYLEKARVENKQKLISFGGAYSNHLMALAVAAKINGFSSLGLVRGEESSGISHTLSTAKKYDMELRFLSRATYDEKKSLLIPGELGEIGSGAVLIPEGGAGPEGLRGAEEILSSFPLSRYSHICTAAGTGTTLAGLANSAASHQKIIGVSVLKGTKDFEPVHISWIKNKRVLQNIQLIHSDHFGGYAKYTVSLLEFMNQTFVSSGIPTDFVYTGKLFYSILRLASAKMFPPGSRILILHTGGLQGNWSLTPGMLQF